MVAHLVGRGPFQGRGVPVCEAFRVLEEAVLLFYIQPPQNIMSFISKLRKKIEPNPEQPFYIQTVRGVGYRFNKEA